MPRPTRVTDRIRDHRTDYRKNKRKRISPYVQRPSSIKTTVNPIDTPGIVQRPSQEWGPLGKSFSTTLRFAKTITINPGTGVSGDHVFSANGIAKPDVTMPNATGQCYGNDELVPFFDHYTVVGSKCTVTACNTPDSTTEAVRPTYIGVAIRDSSSGIYETNQHLRSKPGTNLALMGVNSDTVKSVQQTFSAKKFFGKSKGNIVGDEGLRGTMAGTASNLNMPTEQAYYHVLLCPYWSTYNAGSMTLQVEIEYTCVLTEPKAIVH